MSVENKIRKCMVGNKIQPVWIFWNDKFILTTYFTFCRKQTTSERCVANSVKKAKIAFIFYCGVKDEKVKLIFSSSAFATPLNYIFIINGHQKGSLERKCIKFSNNQKFSQCLKYSLSWYPKRSDIVRIFRIISIAFTWYAVSKCVRVVIIKLKYLFFIYLEFTVIT